MHVCVDCGRKLVKLQRTHTCTRGTCKLHVVRPQIRFDLFLLGNSANQCTTFQFKKKKRKKAVSEPYNTPSCLCRVSVGTPCLANIHMYRVQLVFLPSDLCHLSSEMTSLLPLQCLSLNHYAHFCSAPLTSAYCKI